MIIIKTVLFYNLAMQGNKNMKHYLFGIFFIHILRLFPKGHNLQKSLQLFSKFATDFIFVYVKHELLTSE